MWALRLSGGFAGYFAETLSFTRWALHIDKGDCVSGCQLLLAGLAIRAYALNAKHGLPVDNEVRDQIILDLKQGKDGYDPMGEEEIAHDKPSSSQFVNSHTSPI